MAVWCVLLLHELFSGLVTYTVAGGGQSIDRTALVEIINADGTTVATSDKLNGQMVIKNVHLWWPYGISRKASAYLYQLKV